MPLVPGAVQRADSLRAVLDSVFAAPGYRWDQVTRQEGPLSRLWRAAVMWLYDLQERNPPAFRAFFWILIAALVLVLLHAAFTTWRTVQAATGSSRSEVGGVLRVRDADWFAGETRRLAEAGRFPEAMQADFVRLMLELDARHVVRFHPSKTPGELAREAPSGPVRESLKDLVRTLYRYAFARDSCGSAEFADWRARTNADRYATAH